MPKTMSTIATIQSERKLERMYSCAKKPTSTIGTVPMMMSQPMRTSGSSRGMPRSPPSECEPPRGPNERNHLPMMRVMSFQKYSSTASSVPICVIAVKVAPGSVALGRNSPTMRKWALDEIGRNSVRPWMRPRKSASSRDTRGRSSSG